MQTFVGRRVILKTGCGYFSTDGFHSFARVKSAITGTVDATHGPNIYVKLDDGRRVETAANPALKTICDYCGEESEDVVCQKCSSELPYKMTLQEPMPIPMGRVKRLGKPSLGNDRCPKCGHEAVFLGYLQGATRISWCKNGHICNGDTLYDTIEGFIE
jgi:hypothetical protein